VILVCASCHAPLSRSLQRKVAGGKAYTGLCSKCWRASVRIERNCCDCGKKLANRYAKRCHPCVNALMALDGEREARRLQLAREALKRPEVRARRIRANQRLAARRMAWLPDDYRRDYFRLLKRYGRDQAKAIIRERMTPLERQVSRIMSGEVRVVAKVPMPRPSYDFTLGGVTAA
jgi:hypothetical protein